MGVPVSGTVAEVTGARALTSLETRGPASYLLGLRQPQPQLPPCLELEPVAEQETHLAAGVTGRQRRTVAFGRARVAGCSHFQHATGTRRTPGAGPKSEAWRAWGGTSSSDPAPGPAPEGRDGSSLAHPL